MRPVALDTRRLVSSEFPRCNKGACVPAREALGAGLDRTSI